MCKSCFHSALAASPGAETGLACVTGEGARARSVPASGVRSAFSSWAETLAGPCLPEGPGKAARIAFEPLNLNQRETRKS